MAQRRPPVTGPGRLIAVHPDWTVRVAGMAAAGVCTIRPATLPEAAGAGGLLERAGCRGAAGRQVSGRTLLLLAWLDLDRLPGTAGAGARAAEVVAGGPRVVGCLEVSWPVTTGTGAEAGNRVRLGHLHVESVVRRLGVGRALVSAAEAHCRAAGQLRIMADLTPGPGADAVCSEGADALVAGCGYAPFPLPDDGPVGCGPAGGNGHDAGVAQGQPAAGQLADGQPAEPQPAARRPATGHRGWWWWKDLEQVSARSLVAPAETDLGRRDPRGRRTPGTARPTRGSAAGSRER